MPWVPSATPTLDMWSRNQELKAGFSLTQDQGLGRGPRVRALPAWAAGAVGPYLRRREGLRTQTLGQFSPEPDREGTGSQLLCGSVPSPGSRTGLCGRGAWGKFHEHDGEV